MQAIAKRTSRATDQILRALFDRMGPFDTPFMIRHRFLFNDEAQNFLFNTDYAATEQTNELYDLFKISWQGLLDPPERISSNKYSFPRGKVLRYIIAVKAGCYFSSYETCCVNTRNLLFYVHRNLFQFKGLSLLIWILSQQSSLWSVYVALFSSLL